MKKLKYPMAAQLNKKGMEEFGDIFPDGLIPILSPLSFNAKLGDIGETKIYLVNIPLLYEKDKEGYHKSIRKMSKKFNVPGPAVDIAFRTKGLPLRAELVSCVEIDMRFII